MKIPVYNMAGQEVSSIELPASIFESTVNVGLMHQAVVRQLANMRRGTHKAKGRSEVNRSTAKIYRQKGTGRARHGSRRAPIFVGGGIAHGPKVRDYTKKMPQKMRRAALRSALTVKASNGDVVVLDKITLEAPKTREIVGMVSQVASGESALVVIPGRDEIVEKSTRNISDVKALHAHYLNVRDVLGYEKLILAADALDILIDFLALDEGEWIEEEDIEVDEQEAEVQATEQEEVAQADDLKRIEGIGPKISTVLNEAGLTTFAQLAQTSIEELNQILEGNVQLAFPETWPEQAALAAAGKWDELAELQDELEGGRRVEDSEE